MQTHIRQRIVLALLLVLFVVASGTAVVRAENESYEHPVYFAADPVMKKLTIWLDNQMENVPVSFQVLAGKPADVPAPSSAVNAYFTLETSVQIQRATIEFKVSKDWLSLFRVPENSIKLMKFDNSWRELQTSLVNSSETYVDYEAATSSFSLFAVVGQPLDEPRTLIYVLVVVGAIVAISLVYWALFRSRRLFISLKRLKKSTGAGEVQDIPPAKESAPSVKRLRKTTGRRTEASKAKYTPEKEISHEEDVHLLKELKRKSKVRQR